MSRPTKLTPERQKLILDALSVGATHKMAAGYAKIDEDTFMLWMRQGRQEGAREPYLSFFREVTRIQAQAAVGWLAKIEEAGNADWRALAFKLKARYPEEFGDRMTHAGDKEQPVTVRVVYDDTPAEGPS